MSVALRGRMGDFLFPATIARNLSAVKRFSSDGAGPKQTFSMKDLPFLAIYSKIALQFFRNCSAVFLQKKGRERKK
jgi:hypothetical protein